MTTRRKLGTRQLQLRHQAQMVRWVDVLILRVRAVESDSTFADVNRRIDKNIVYGHAERCVSALLRQPGGFHQRIPRRMT